MLNKSGKERSDATSAISNWRTRGVDTTDAVARPKTSPLTYWEHTISKTETLNVFHVEFEERGAESCDLSPRMKGTAMDLFWQPPIEFR